MNEEVLIFGTPPLTGVLTRPAGGRASDLPGVVLLSPGLLHRVGPNRLYVKLARALAAEGYHVLRFDFSGQGDSPPRGDHLPIEQGAVAETGAALAQLAALSGCARFLLIGHCSGAIFSLLTAFADPRVIGVVAISPEGGDQQWVEFDRRQKEARYYANYYGQGALGDAGRWRRLLTGKAHYGSIIRNVLRNIVWYRLSALAYRRGSASGKAAQAAGERPEVVAFKEGLRALAARRAQILFLHPDQSAGRELIRATLGDTIDRLREAGDLEVALIAESDHLFTPLAAQRELLGAIGRWVRAQGACGSPETPASGREAEAGGSLAAKAGCR